jgi:hypothetical protein
MRNAHNKSIARECSEQKHNEKCLEQEHDKI